MKGGVSGTAYESDPAKNDGFIRTLNERIDEVKKSVKDAEAQMETQTEQLRKEESAIRELEARVQGGGYEDDAADRFIGSGESARSTDQSKRARKSGQQWVSIKTCTSRTPGH